MEFFKKTNIDFMGLKKVCAALSVVMFVFSIIAIAVNGLNLGLDFTGGTQIQASFDSPVDLSAIRVRLDDAGFLHADVRTYGENTGTKTTSLIRVGNKAGVTDAQISKDIQAILPDAKIESVEYIGPEVGKELATNGLLALLVALILTTIYIALRFESRFAISSAVALIHDPVLILGIFAFFHVDFDITALVALLTVLGYSLNDTIVVFDRVRENFRKLRKKTPSEVINISVNETLSRTIMTSALTLTAVIALFVYGGPKVHSFSLAMLIGIVVGTYSSIYVAGSLAVVLGLNRKDFLPRENNVIDDRP
jgi:preprotein translocase subunit SecF